MLGAAFFIPTAVVPPLLIMHGLIFWLLVRPKAVKAASHLGATCCLCRGRVPANQGLEPTLRSARLPPGVGRHEQRALD